jgi:hypothetical protein
MPTENHQCAVTVAASVPPVPMPLCHSSGHTHLVSEPTHVQGGQGDPPVASDPPSQVLSANADGPKRALSEARAVAVGGALAHERRHFDPAHPVRDTRKMYIYLRGSNSYCLVLTRMEISSRTREKTAYGVMWEGHRVRFLQLPFQLHAQQRLQSH